MQLVLAAMLFLSQLALGQFSQQWKLVGTGAIGNATEGISVALSADGKTAIVGGPMDDPGNGTFPAQGAAWVFTRSGSGVWTQQGKLVGTGTGASRASQGQSVALSADGNTAIVGGYMATRAGGAWVFTRSSSGLWTQQGGNLIDLSGPGGFERGISVALSSDGNTAIVGGPDDAWGGQGVALVFTRSGGVWTQQGSKLVATGLTSSYDIEMSVALSSDGNTVIVGEAGDDNYKGAAWVFTRSGGVWTQQGGKLVGTGAIGPEGWQGISVALSSDGNTAIVGGLGDNARTGAAWVYTRSGGVWTQQGSKLVGTGAIGLAAWQGQSVALSADGNTAIVGGYMDDFFNSTPTIAGATGAAWVYTRSGGVWTQQGSKLVGMGAIGWAYQGISVALSSDGNTVIVGGYRDNGDKGAVWVYGNQNPQKQPWRVAIDPMALILNGKALDIWFEMHHPNEPSVAQIQEVLRSMTPEERKETLNRASTLRNNAKAEEKMLQFMTPAQQKVALNRARTLENYGKAVEEAFATMKK